MKKILNNEEIFQIGKEFIRGKGYACKLQLKDENYFVFPLPSVSLRSTASPPVGGRSQGELVITKLATA